MHAPHVLPRPYLQGKRTAEMVHKVEDKLGRYANELEELRARLVLANALLQPDPAPGEVQLTLVTDASACESRARKNVHGHASGHVFACV